MKKCAHTAKFIKLTICGLAATVLLGFVVFEVSLHNNPFYYGGDLVDPVYETALQEPVSDGSIRVAKIDRDTGRGVVSTFTYQPKIGFKRTIAMPTMDYDGTRFQLIFDNRILVGYLDMMALDYTDKAIKSDYDTERLQEIFDEYNRQVTALFE